jgi:membrane-associated protease RseP (regulator of RpoE activity)
LGAFIRIRGPIVRRTVLLDIGVGGPIASFVLSVLFFFVGLAFSEPVGSAAGSGMTMLVKFAGQPIWLGSGLAVKGIQYVLFPADLSVDPLLLHPVAFAAWIGLFVTFLNLLPFGQLDGGHILYAVSSTVQRWAAAAFLLALLPLGRLWWGWWLWAVIAVFLSRGRLAHPKVLQPQVTLDPVRTAITWSAILIFFLTFVPPPVRF